MLQSDYIIEQRPGETDEEYKKRRRKVLLQRQADYMPMGLGGGSGPGDKPLIPGDYIHYTYSPNDGFVLVQGENYIEDKGNT